MQLPIRPKCSD